MYENLDFIQGSYMISLVSYKDHISFLWSHTRIIHFFKRVFFFVSRMVHLWFLGFHARVMYENLDFIQGSYMISLVSYKDHIWFLWSHTRIIHFFKCVFLLFLNAILELFIYDFLDFMLGSCMKTWISYKDHVWFLWFHTRIVLRNQVWTVWNHIWSLYEIKETSTWAVKNETSAVIKDFSTIINNRSGFIIWSSAGHKSFYKSIILS